MRERADTDGKIVMQTSCFFSFSSRLWDLNRTEPTVKMDRLRDLGRTEPTAKRARQKIDNSIV